MVNIKKAIQWELENSPTSYNNLVETLKQAVSYRLIAEIDKLHDAGYMQEDRYKSFVVVRSEYEWDFTAIYSKNEEFRYSYLEEYDKKEYRSIEQFDKDIRKELSSLSPQELVTEMVRYFIK